MKGKVALFYLYKVADTRRYNLETALSGWRMECLPPVHVGIL